MSFKMKEGWGKSLEDYAKNGGVKQMASKGDPPSNVSREKWEERKARRDEEMIDYYVSMGFSRRYLESELLRQRLGASIGNLARKG